MPNPPDPATMEALMRMASGPNPMVPGMDWMAPSPRQQPSELSQTIHQIDALRKALPLSFKAKKGGGVLTYREKF